MIMYSFAMNLLHMQAKQEYQKVMMQLMEERQQHEAAIAEYKQVQHGVKVLHDHTMLTSSCDC